MERLHVLIKNVYSELSDWDEGLEKKLTVKHENYWFSPQFKAGYWDGKTHFLKIPSLKFPTGLFFIVKEYCAENRIKLTISDHRDRSGMFSDVDYFFKPDMLEGIILRDYQIESINMALKTQRGILHLPTGSGKTEIAIGIVTTLNLPVLYLVHTKDLLHQTVERFIKRIPGVKVGKLGDSYKEIEGNDIIVATVQTLNNLMKNKLPETKKLFQRSKILILDECHHASATTWYKIAMFAHDSFYRFGFSGTPLSRSKLSNMKLQACIGELIYDLPTMDLIEKGDLCDIELNMVENIERVNELNWRAIYREGVVHSGYRNQMIVELAEKHFEENKNVMILIRHIQHGENLKGYLKLRKIPHIFLQGKDASDKRELEKQRFQSDDKFVLIASGIYDEGVDLPEVNILILAGGGKSQVKTIQRVGRGLRKKKDGGHLTVYDFMDSSKYIDKHSIERKKIYKKEGFIKED